jgi:hypothetical protein
VSCIVVSLSNYYWASVVSLTCAVGNFIQHFAAVFIIIVCSNDY